MSSAFSKAGHTGQLSMGYLCLFSRGQGERLWRTSHREKQAFEQPTGRACSSPSLLVLEEKQTSAFEQLSGELEDSPSWGRDLSLFFQATHLRSSQQSLQFGARKAIGSWLICLSELHKKTRILCSL